MKQAVQTSVGGCWMLSSFSIFFLSLATGNADEINNLDEHLKEKQALYFDSFHFSLVVFHYSPPFKLLNTVFSVTFFFWGKIGIRIIYK